MADNIIYLIASVLPFLCCLWWTITLFLEKLSGRNQSPAAGAFLNFVAVSTILYFCHFCHFVFPNSTIATFAESVWIFCTLSVYPLFGFWIYRLTNAEPGRKGTAGFTIPATVILIPSLVFFTISVVFTIAGVGRKWLMLAVKLFFAAEVVFTAVYGIKALRTYRIVIANFYADTEGKELRSVGTMLTLLLLTSLFSMVSNLVGRDLFVGSVLLVIPSLVFTVLLYSISYIGRRPVFDASSMQKDLIQEEGTDAEEKQNTEEDRPDVLLQRIWHAMEADRLYLRQGLKISDLALAVGSNRSYVSNCINNNLGLSFSDFVASYRIKEAVSLLEDVSEGVSIESIGWKSGFASRSQFYRSFKKETGMSPGQWLEKH